jgi:hypothetical protein
MRKLFLVAIGGVLVLASMGWFISALHGGGRVEATRDLGVNPFQIMIDRKQLPAEHTSDLSVVFP